ncbi:MAG: sulfatase [Verrucomicrobiota bacterium]
MRAVLILLVTLLPALSEQKLPNVLWITSEDNAAHWLGCYGNEQAKTPRLDALATEGFRFEHAYSNAPVCAVARSMILNGAHAVTMGTQNMRSRHPIPERYRPYVSYLREKGYYCTNNSKTDYNFEGNDRSIWNECSNKAHYRKRPEGAPFFAIFNLTTTHESQLFPDKNPAGPGRLKAKDVIVPPYFPDLPEVRSDISRYHDRMTVLDTQIGKILDELEKAGLADDTIVFYYSDHGGPTPRGKRYLKDTGVQVPMIVRIPDKWKELSPFKAGETVEELVGFVDLAPTLLSIIGLETPKQMQGRAFLGEHRKEPVEDAMVFLQADRFDEIYGMRRGLTDGRWKYIRRFTPHRPAAPYSFYQFSMPSWVAWQNAWQEGKLDERHARIWEAPQAVEELFDLEADPWEVENLVDDPAHSARLEAMRARLQQEMLEKRDTGVIPEPMWEDLIGEGTIAEHAASTESGFEEVLRAAFQFSDFRETTGGALRIHSAHENPALRYWVLLGNLNLVESGDGGIEVKARELDDKVSLNRVTAAELLIAAGRVEEGKKILLSELMRSDIGGYSMLYLGNVIFNRGLIDEVPSEWVEGVMADKQANDYVKRFARQILDRQGER